MHGGVWSVGVLPSKVQRICAPGVDVVKTTGTDPSYAPLLGEMVGAAALTSNVPEETRSLISRLAFVAIAFITIFVELICMLPL